MTKFGRIPKLTILYAYITNPIRILSLNKSLELGKLPLFALGLSTLSGIVPGASIFDISLWLSALGLMITTMGILALQATSIDFMAQYFKLHAQSYLLFKWLCLTTLPNCLATPLFLISFSLGNTHSNLYDFLTSMLFILGLSLQFFTIKILYETTNTKALLLLFLPIITALISAIGITLFWVLAILPGSFYTAWP